VEWQGKMRGGAWGNRFFIKTVKVFGIRFACFFLWLVVPYFVPFAPKATKSSWRYGRRILKMGRLRAAVFVYQRYYCFGQTLIDRIAAGCGLHTRYRFSFDNYDRFLDLLNSRQGVIIIGAHAGNWEMGAPFFEHYGKKINIVLYDGEYQKIKQVKEQELAAANYKIIPIVQGSLAHVLSLKSALDRHEYLCFQGDRSVSDERCLVAKFMGFEARFPSGPFLLASRMQAPVVFYFAMRQKGLAYRFYFTVAENSGRKLTEQQLLEQYTETLETVMNEYPLQWFNFFDFWGFDSPSEK
jgi:predicted LPLAT superfamily acyltransferase